MSKINTLFGKIDVVETVEDKVKKIELFDFLNASMNKRGVDSVMKQAVNSSAYSKFMLNRFYCTDDYIDIVNELNLYSNGISNEMHLDFLRCVKKGNEFLKYKFKSENDDDKNAIKWFHKIDDDYATKVLQLYKDFHNDYLDKIKEDYNEYIKMGGAENGKKKNTSNRSKNKKTL